MTQTKCDFCGRVKAQNEKFKSKNGVDVCERCEAVIERFKKEEVTGHCKWKMSGHQVYHASCGYSFSFDGGAMFLENWQKEGFKYCPSCKQEIKEV